MEENKKRNGGLFYAIVGVATLVVTIAGSTFAYFSASANSTGTAISGQTNNISASSLTITTARLNLSPSPAPASDNLVPADFGVTAANMTTTTVNKALTAKCVNNGYTGCHVWKITAKCAQNVSNASVKLNLSLSNVTDKGEWSYVAYTGSDTAASSLINKNAITTTFPNSSTTIDLNNNGALTTSNKYFYVMVYLRNTDSAQNDGSATGTTNATGSYTGTVTLEVMGNQVKASFTA